MHVVLSRFMVYPGATVFKLGSIFVVRIHYKQPQPLNLTPKLSTFHLKPQTPSIPLLARIGGTLFE